MTMFMLFPNSLVHPFTEEVISHQYNKQATYEINLNFLKMCQ